MGAAASARADETVVAACVENQPVSSVRAAADTGIEETELRGQRRGDGWGV